VIWVQFVGLYGRNLGEIKVCQDIWYNERMALNQLVAGSNPAGLIIRDWLSQVITDQTM